MAKKHRVKTHEIRFKVSEDELRIAKEKAALADISVSDYMRSILIHGFVFTNQNKELIREIAAQINPIGVNINQIARRVNEKDIATAEDIEALKEQFAEIQAIISQKLFGE